MLDHLSLNHVLSSLAFPGEWENCTNETILLNSLPCWTGVRSHSLLLSQCSGNRLHIVKPFPTAVVGQH